MNSILKTLVLMVGLSLTLFSIFLSLDSNKKKDSIVIKKHSKKNDTNDSSLDYKNKKFRDYVMESKKKIFKDLEENWCTKFNCN